MTVAQLIEKLQKTPQDREVEYVAVTDNGGLILCEINFVYEADSQNTEEHSDVVWLSTLEIEQ